MDDIKGTLASETINATAVSPTTGAAVTNLSSGDKIDGGAGTDTLNVTLTAANNSLTGVSVSNVEVINITGANNTASSTTATSAASAGAKQVQVLDIANLSLEAEQQTISYVGLAKSATAGTVALTVLGETVTTASIAADADAATLATAVATAINASTATPSVLGAGSGTVKSLVTATATSGIVTLKFAVGLGDAAATTQASTGIVTEGTVSATAPTIAETVTSSAELQDLDLDTWVKKGAGTAEVIVLGTTVTTASIADNAADTVVATAVALAINTAAGAGGIAALLGKVSAVASGDNVILTYAASVGDGAAASMQYDLAAAAATAVFDDGTIAKSADAAAGETRKGGEVDLTVGLNGANYTVTSVIDGGILSATSATALAAQNTSKDAARTAIKTQLSAVLGDGVTVGDSDESGEIKLTSKTTGTALPSVTATGRDSTTNLISEDSADAAKVANAETTSATGAVAQQVQYTVGGTVAAADSFAIYIDGVSYGSVNPTSTTALSATTPLAAGLNAILGTGVAVVVGGSITITAPTAGVPLPVISITKTDAAGSDLTLARTDLRDNGDVLGTTTTAGSASVAASSFTGAEQIWLKGATSNATALTGVAAGQTAGFSGVTSMANSVTFGATVTAGNVNVSASAGALSVTGAKMTTLNLSGTGSTGLTLTDGSSIDTVATIAASTSGGTVLDTAAATAVTALTQSGKGGVTLKNAGVKLASVATGAGADNVKINTTTAVDNANTAANETVTASVSTGDGADKVTVATTGTGGLTSVETGAGADTVYVTTVGTGVSSINTGADGDTVDIIGISLGSYPNLTINGGAGTDTVVTAGATFSAVDYLRMNAALSDFEGMKFSSAVGGIDASKLAIGSITGFTFNAGANVITEVGTGQTLTLASVAAATTAATNQPAGSNYAGTATQLTAAAAGYVAGTTGGAPTTVYGGSLDVVSKSDANTLEVNGSSATVAVTSTGGSSATSIAADVTLTTTDVQSLVVNLTSARGAGANVVTEYKAAFDAGTISDAAAVLGNTHLESLASVTVTGTGGFTIDTGTVVKTLADLTTIDVSGMATMVELNALGEATSTNVSTTAITLNTNVSESVLLGGARDTINTNSTVANPDTITGFTLTPDATTPTTLDTARSDVLNVQTGAGALTFVKFATTATTYAGALTDAGASALGANLLFAFGGDTYAYVDQGAAGLDDADLLVKLVGTYDLDLLISAVG